MIKRILCWMNLHRWDYPGGCCEDCGIHDDFFDNDEVPHPRDKDQ